MAKAIATVGGIALAPGVSKNRRLYTAEAIAKAVRRAQDRIAAGGVIAIGERGATHPITTLTHHGAEGDPTRIVGGLKSLELDEQGRARFAADVADTDHGRTIANLVDTSDGQPAFLRGVSIRGHWIGKVRRVTGPDGGPVETADDLEIDGLDYTPNPGVGAAGIDAFSWTGGGKRASETTEQVFITESVEEARVETISEPAEPVDEGSPSGEASDPPGVPLELAAHVLEDGECVTCRVAEARQPMSKRGSGTSGPGGPYADPGYQDDKKQRYQLDSRIHSKAAWSYINQKGNAAKYTAAQLKRIKSRIMKALRKFGVKVTSEGWVIDTPVLITEAIAEHYGDPTLCGSWSISASNGPVNINLSSYSMDPADLDVILRAAADAACTALARLDPDMDGDIDLPGAPGSDDDMDSSALTVPPLTLTGDESAESAEDTDPADPAESQEEAPAPEPAAGDTTEGDPEMSGSTTAAAETAPAATFTQADLDAAAKRAATAALDADREARRARKAARRAQPAESAPAAPPAEAAPAPAAAAAVQESEDERINRIVSEKLAAERGQAAPAVQETDEQRVNRLVEERLTEERQRLVASGQVGIQRAGLVKPVTEATAASGGSESLNEWGLPANWPNKAPHEYTPDERDTYMGPALTRHVLGPRADLIA